MALPRPTLAKILATIGPASDKPETIGKLIDAGVACFRLNFSHGTMADHERRLRAIREVAQEKGVAIGVLGDLPGPKVRIGAVPEGGIALSAGDDFLIDPRVATAAPGAAGRPPIFGCTYAGICQDVATGQRVLINDGAVRAFAVGSEAGDPPGTLRCRVTTGGLVTSGKGINLPQTEMRLPAMGERDWACVEWAVRHGIDYLALSFVRTAEEVRELRDRLAGMCSVEGEGGGVAAAIPVIAKIEKPQAVANLEAICAEADGLMVARGDLGVEMDIAQVPVVQRSIVKTCDAYGKPCIVATQMLESMIGAPGPTRAEASDVATAVLQGADAVMLSAETAAGQFPVLAVETMRRIIEATETHMRQMARATGADEQRPTPPSRLAQPGYRTAALAHGAWYVARDIGACMVVCWSQRGGAARYLSQTGLGVPIIAYSSSARETRRMSLLKGVVGLRMDPPADSSLAEWNKRVDEDLLSHDWAAKGDPVVLLAGQPLGVQGSANTLAVHYVGDERSGFRRRGAHP
jgi:pyruvate kinase